MTFQTALMTVGQYLLLAVGLILLLFILILAVAFLLTLFMRFFADISFQTVGSEIRQSIRLRFKILFYEILLLDIDDFDEDSESGFESGASGPEKNTYHVTVTDDKITVQTVESQKSGSEYEIIVNAEETTTITKDIEISDDPQTVVLETSEVFSEAEDTTYEEDEIDEEPADEEESDFDLSDSYDEIKRYVDLSDPGQFVSDSMGAAVRISKVSARFAGDLLLRAKIDNMSADVIYGLSDPANTALSFGAVHSFMAFVYAYLANVEETSRSSKKRQKAAEIGAVIRDDIHIVPDMTGKVFEADADMSFSFWIPRLYIPALRFLLNKNTRWVIRRYLYPYFIRQYIRTWKADRRQKKAAKKSKSEMSS